MVVLRCGTPLQHVCVLNTPYVLMIESMRADRIVSVRNISRRLNSVRMCPARKAAIGIVLVSAAVNTIGCSMKRMAVTPPQAPDQGIIGSDTDRLQESLFKGDQAVLSNQDIERILTARITLADRHRVAVLHLNARNIFYQEIADLEAQNSERFLKAL